MNSTKQELALSQEEEIVWLDDISKYPYVREWLNQFASRRRGRIKAPLQPPDGKLVGYANLRADAKSWMPGQFHRRVFWVKPYDRSEDPDGIYRHHAPAEAVDPRLVRAGVASPEGFYG